MGIISNKEIEDEVKKEVTKEEGEGQTLLKEEKRKSPKEVKKEGQGQGQLLEVTKDVGEGQTLLKVTEEKRKSPKEVKKEGQGHTKLEGQKIQGQGQLLEVPKEVKSEKKPHEEKVTTVSKVETIVKKSLVKGSKRRLLMEVTK